MGTNGGIRAPWHNWVRVGKWFLAGAVVVARVGVLRDGPSQAQSLLRTNGVSIFPLILRSD